MSPDRQIGGSRRQTDPGRPARLRPAVVLVRPREEGNIGAVARAMANMGLHELVLVQPAPELGGQARGFGVGGWHILDAARRYDDLSQALAPFRVAVGTTSARGRPLRGQKVMPARELPAELERLSRQAEEPRIALVFGPEDKGLARHELAQCHPIVYVPCASQNPTLNLAQAVLLVSYELFRDPGEDALVLSEEDPPAPHEEVGRLLERISPLVHRLGYDHRHLQGSIVRDLGLLLTRAAPSRREVGLLRRLVERCRQQLGLNEDADETR